MASLPSNTFLINYNARFYDPTTHTIPKTEGQIFDQDLVLNGNPSSYTDSSITVNGQYLDYTFNNNANNPFNRSGSDSLTIVMKAKPSSLTSGAHSLFSNRGGSYNWMVFNPANGSPAGMFFLHTANGAYAYAPYVQAVSLTDPNVFAFRVANGSGYGQSYTDNNTFRSTGVTWGGITNVIHILGGSNTQEYWSGEFFWMYISTEALTDNEIQAVIAYNENYSSFSVSETALTGSYQTTAFTVGLTASDNTTWSATTVPSWITVSPSTGDSSATLTITFAKNSTYSQRTGTIVFTDSESNTCEIECTQAKHPIIIPKNNIFRGGKQIS